MYPVAGLPRAAATQPRNPQPMYEKLDEIEKRYDELQAKIGDPSVATDVSAYRAAMKAIAEIEDVVAKHRELKAIRNRLLDARELLRSDDAMNELAELQITKL